jgi:hypothetical protein
VVSAPQKRSSRPFENTTGIGHQNTEGKVPWLPNDKRPPLGRTSKKRPKPQRANAQSRSFLRKPGPPWEKRVRKPPSGIAVSTVESLLQLAGTKSISPLLRRCRWHGRRCGKRSAICADQSSAFNSLRDLRSPHKFSLQLLNKLEQQWPPPVIF